MLNQQMKERLQAMNKNTQEQISHNTMIRFIGDQAYIAMHIMGSSTWNVFEAYEKHVKDHWTTSNNAMTFNDWIK